MTFLFNTDDINADLLGVSWSDPELLHCSWGKREHHRESRTKGSHSMEANRTGHIRKPERANLLAG